MEPTRWLESWEAGRIGFHKDQVHPDLPKYEERFLGGGPHRVFVPLAGKTWDLTWLSRRGHGVTAVELSPIAARAFHREQGIDAEVGEDGSHQIWRSPNLDYFVGDLFDLGMPAAGAFTRVWDRASMVALDPPRRERYLAHLRQLAPGATLLLNVFEYDTSKMDGPPHSIPDAEVRASYPDAELLHEVDAISKLGPLAERGHTWWMQRTYLATVPNSVR